MARRTPWMQFFAGDWLNDPLVSQCDPATRGIWMDLLCAMHQLDQRGQISGTLEKLARIARCTAEEMHKAVDDLRATGAADVQICNGVVTLVNRRMHRESEQRQANYTRQLRKRGKIPPRESNGVVTPLSRDCHGVDSDSDSYSPPKPPLSGEGPSGPERPQPAARFSSPASPSSVRAPAPAAAPELDVPAHVHGLPPADEPVGLTPEAARLLRDTGLNVHVGSQKQRRMVNEMVASWGYDAMVAAIMEGRSTGKGGFGLLVWAERAAAGRDYEQNHKRKQEQQRPSIGGALLREDR